MVIIGSSFLFKKFLFKLKSIALFVIKAKGTPNPGVKKLEGVISSGSISKLGILIS